MGVVFRLFKLQIDELYNIFKLKNFDKLARSAGKFVLLIGLLYIIIYVLFLNIFPLGFAINKQLLAIILLVTQIMALIFATGNILTNVFFNKNNEILLTMPASSNQVFLSKILLIYVHEIIVNTIYTLPLMLALGVVGKFGWTFFALLPLFMLFLPLIPISIASLLSIPLAQALKFLKKHALVSSIIMLSVVAAGLYFYVSALGALSKFDIGNKQLETVISVNKAVISFGDSIWLFLRLAESMLEPSKLFWALCYVGIGAFALTASIFVIKPFFFRTAMQSNENSISKAKAGKYSIHSPFFSFVKKEYLTVFRSPGYVFQFFIFALLMPIIVILFDRLLLTMEIVTQTGRMMIAGAHVIIVALLAMLSNIISASALSREGMNFYLIKTSPVNYYVQTGAKIVFNALITVTAVILTCIMTLASSIFTEPDIGVGAVICTTIAVIFISIGHICLSFDMDLKKPYLSWYDSGDIIKASPNTAKSILVAIFLSILMGTFIIACSSLELTIIPWVVLILGSIAFCCYKVYLLILRVSYQYEKLEM